jgi:hypothetical protein
MLLYGFAESIVLVTSRPPSIFESAAWILLRSTRSLYDSIERDMFEYDNFSHRLISDYKHKNSKVKNRQEDQRSGQSNAEVESSIIRLLTCKSVSRQSNKTAKRIHDDIRDIGGTDRQDILNDFNGETEGEEDRESCT